MTDISRLGHAIGLKHFKHRLVMGLRQRGPDLKFPHGTNPRKGRNCRLQAIPRTNDAGPVVLRQALHPRFRQRAWRRKSPGRKQTDCQYSDTVNSRSGRKHMTGGTIPADSPGLTGSCRRDFRRGGKPEHRKKTMWTDLWITFVTGGGRDADGLYRTRPQGFPAAHAYWLRLQTKRSADAKGNGESTKPDELRSQGSELSMFN